MSPRQGASKDPNYLHYLPFVDGLRAISIVAVVLYHIGVPGISGGFVGVDIFFVISGFLIINQIKAGLISTGFRFFPSMRKERCASCQSICLFCCLHSLRRHFFS